MRRKIVFVTDVMPPKATLLDSMTLEMTTACVGGRERGESRWVSRACTRVCEHRSLLAAARPPAVMSITTIRSVDVIDRNYTESQRDLDAMN